MILVWPRLHSEPLEHRPDIGRIARQEDAVAVHLVGALAAKVLGRIGEGIESERRARSERQLRNYSAKQARRGSPDRAGGRRPLLRTRRDQERGDAGDPLCLRDASDPVCRGRDRARLARADWHAHRRVHGFCGLSPSIFKIEDREKITCLRPAATRT